MYDKAFPNAGASPIQRLGLILTFLAMAAAAQTAPSAAGVQNGVYLPGSCASDSPPSWCKGSDIGAWTNAAITAAGCGEVYLPAGTFKQSTTIKQPRCIRLHASSGYGTTLTYMPKSGCSIVIADGSEESSYPPGGIQDLNLSGPGPGTNTCGIYFGGSDGSLTAPSTDIDPVANHGDHAVANRTRITRFGVGVQYGFNTWLNTLLEDVITSNGTGVLFPAKVAAGNPASNSGENMNIVASAIQNNSDIGLKIGTGLQVNFNVVGTSFNFNGSWGIQNGTATSENSITCTGCYVTVSSGGWYQNYGYATFSGSYMNGGQKNTTVPMIDNEGRQNTLLGGQFFNGSSTQNLLNLSGHCSTLISAILTGHGAGSLVPSSGAICTLTDTFGALYTSSNYVGTLDQKNGSNQYAGTSACSNGTKTITFGLKYAHPPVVIVTDQTNGGGANVTSRSSSQFTVSCRGASDSFDWISVGNPN